MTIQETAAFLKEHDDFILTSHETPDADGLGAEYALLRALRSIGKRARAINGEDYSPKYRFIDDTSIIERFGAASIDGRAIAMATVIILDTSDIQYTGSMADSIVAKAKNALMIDHHEVNGSKQNPLCSYPEMSSTCELVYRIIKELGCGMSGDMAMALFAGIVYDTGSFAYSKTSVGTFEAAVDLVREGANPYDVHSALYESSGTNALMLRKAVLSTLELYADDRVAVQTMTAGMLRDTRSSYEDADELINGPLQATTVEVSVFIKESTDGVIRCSLRSKGSVNVAQVAQSFGGGGHMRAAGFKSPFPLDTMKSEVVKIVVAALPR